MSRTIQVTARFEVTFDHVVTDEVFAMLEQGTRIDVIDESVAYRFAATDGTCEMDWDFHAPSKKKARMR